MKKILSIVIVIFIVGALAFWWNGALSAVNPKNTTQQYFVVEKGQSAREIGLNLKKQGLIKDPNIFYLYVKLTGKDKRIQTGDFKIAESMNVSRIITILTSAPIDVWITIPEGLRAQEIADILESDIPTYEENWRDKLQEQEGFLFPDTYLIPRTASIEQILEIFANNFDQKVESIGLSRNSPNINKAITIASLIEREALRDSEKPLIASVIDNRLDRGMALDIDATLQYAKGKVGGKWWSVPTAEDKEINSPYNTYRNPGLPPGPIANPGLAAIKAAQNPEPSNYFFYLHDSQGNVHFSRTLEEHQRNIQKYL